MKKIEKRFEFDMPLSKTFQKTAFDKPYRTVLMGVMTVSYVGYDYGLSMNECLDNDEDRFEVDVDSVKYEGTEIISILKSDLFEDVLREIEQAAMNDVAYQFEEYELAKKHLEHDEY